MLPQEAIVTLACGVQHEVMKTSGSEDLSIQYNSFWLPQKQKLLVIVVIVASSKLLRYHRVGACLFKGGA